MTSLDYDKAYYEGYNAFINKLEDFDNPYNWLDDRYLKWYNGWQDSACIPL